MTHEARVLQFADPFSSKAVMTVITTRIRVDLDHTISGVAPQQIPPGEHIASIDLGARPARQVASEPLDANALPIRDLGPWPAAANLRREDL